MHELLHLKNSLYTLLYTRPGPLDTVFIGQASHAMPGLVSDNRPIACQGDDEPSATSTASPPGLIEQDEHKIIVRDPGIERVLEQGLGVGPIFEPAMGPGAIVNVAERRVLQGGADNVAIGVVDPLAHPRIS